MKATRYITQFYRILPTRAVDKKYIHKRSSKKLHQFDENAPHLRILEEHPLESLVWTGPYGKVLLYAVRVADSYVLSINGRSKLYSKNSDIFKALVGKRVIPDNPYVADLFQNNRMLDLQEIMFLANSECDAANLDSVANYRKLPAYDWIIEQKDVHVDHSGRANMHSIIPCLHEDKVVDELFLETRSITDERRDELKKEGFKEYRGSYMISDEAMQELLERVGIYF